ncbi:MAG: amidohydrolase family protein [Planctomycetota bacterium]
MKIAGHLMLPDDGECVRLAPGWLRVEGGRIAEVIEGDIPSNVDLGGEGHVVCPGFVDAHLHLPQFGVIGAHGLGLLDWLEQVTFPAEQRWADPAAARSDTESAIRRMLRCGTTGFAGYATVHAEGARAALETADRMGVRAHIGQVLMDRGAPADLCRPSEQLIEETTALLEQFPLSPAGGRVSAAVTPRFAPTCSEGMLAAAGELSQKHSAFVQTHLAETRAECELVETLFGGRRYTEIYRDTGLLHPTTLLGHGIYLNAADRLMIAQHGSSIAHCPTANSFLMSGRMDWNQAKAHPMVLGSDIGGGYEVSMVRVARAMLETAGGLLIDDPSRDAGTVPTAAHAWWQITHGNARTLRWTDTGVLQTGCAADLVLVRPDDDVMRTLFSDKPTHNTPHGPRHPDPLAGVMFGWDDRWIERVLLAGNTMWP